MNNSAERMFNNLTNIKADEHLVTQAAQLMKSKLAKKRGEGYGGWHKQHSCNNEWLMQKLNEHVTKGDMADVMNFAAMIAARTNIYGDKA